MEVHTKTLTPDELEAAERLAKSVKRGVADVIEGRTECRPAKELLAELKENR